MAKAGRRWTSKEDLLLLKMYADCSAADCAKQLGRSERSVIVHAARLGFQRQRNFTRRERKGVCRCGECAVCKARARRYAYLARQKAGMPLLRSEWTRGELSQLRKLHPKLTYAEIAKRLGKTGAAVRNKAKKLGLPSKPPGRRRICDCGTCKTCVRRAYVAWLQQRSAG